jgi:hypothetical protein
MLWVENTGKISLWTLGADGAAQSKKDYGPYTNWRVINCSNN